MKSVVVCFVLLVCNTQVPFGNSFASDSEDRIAVFLQNERDVDKRFSVNILSDTLVSFPAHEADNLGGVRFLQRLIGDDGQQFRLDGMSRQDFGLRDPVYECQLLLANECLYVSTKTGRPEVSRYQVRAGQTTLVTLTRRNDPFKLTTTTPEGAMIERISGIFNTRFKVLEETTLKDGRLKSLISPGNNIGWEVVFSSDPDWLPVEVRFFARTGQPLKEGKIEAKTVRGWDLIATTKTEWTEADSDAFWVPKYVSMESEQGGQTRSSQYYFSDWKFGESVDMKMLDPTNFSKASLPSKGAFEKMEKDFSKLIEQKQKPKSK